LASWFETTGLASLEAAASGCSVVSTNRGYVREYFLDLVQYCDPAAKRSIREAVIRSLEEAPSRELRTRVLACFTWNRVAQATLDAYRRVTGPIID
jgi:glycosyltransferase involved in cell wall biosynthesis